MVIKFPALSPTMTEGTISSWEKKVGDEVDEVNFFRFVKTRSTTDFFHPKKIKNRETF